KLDRVRVVATRMHSPGSTSPDVGSSEPTTDPSAPSTPAPPAKPAPGSGRGAAPSLECRSEPGSLTVMWQGPSDATGYTVQMDDGWEDHVGAGSLGNSYISTGVAPQSRHTFKIATLGGSGAGATASITCTAS